MAIITLTLPDEVADRMRQKSGEFYLDVFGWVRDQETTEAIGTWGRNER